VVDFVKVFLILIINLLDVDALKKKAIKQYNELLKKVQGGKDPDY
jgi:hypothetical protein